ncbi:hypothetical protein JQ616_16175 [Bradyrhizobium tropiciagri]|uniref:hypothetical protein n=1 Tax=Bradyrhizobium tropiciagri TaxID=312253 RepID=UPI001BA8AB09|nr:hypothetical protein [Bradyrhizobium tropiciagri]MBR0896499.1 hypothetical protein [Bradyrhizobium tropiciagri]
MESPVTGKRGHEKSVSSRKQSAVQRRKPQIWYDGPISIAAIVTNGLNRNTGQCIAASIAGGSDMVGVHHRLGRGQ